MLSSDAQRQIVFADTRLFPKENLFMADALLPTEGEAQSPVAEAKKPAATRSLFDTQALTELALIGPSLVRPSAPSVSRRSPPRRSLPPLRPYS